MSAFTLLNQAVASCLVPCPPLSLAKQFLMDGDWNKAIRYLQTVSAEDHGADTKLRAEEIQKALQEEIGTQLKTLWADTFQGSLAVDFVCRNLEKMRVLKMAMEASDLVPMIFNVQATEDPERVRVTIEL